MNSLKFIAVAAFVAGISTGFAADRSIRQKGKVFSESEISLKKGDVIDLRERRQHRAQRPFDHRPARNSISA